MEILKKLKGISTLIIFFPLSECHFFHLLGLTFVQEFSYCVLSNNSFTFIESTYLHLFNMLNKIFHIAPLHLLSLYMYILDNMVDV